MFNSLIFWVARFRVSIVIVTMAMSMALGSLEHLEEADEEDYDLYNANETSKYFFLIYFILKRGHFCVHHM